jgi:hypothetical protein
VAECAVVGATFCSLPLGQLRKQTTGAKPLDLNFT